MFSSPSSSSFLFVCSGVTLFFAHWPSWATALEHFEIFSHPQENQLVQQFFVKCNFLFFFFFHFLMLGVFYSNVEEDKHNNCPLKRKQTSTLYTNQNFIKRQKTIFNIVLFTVLHLLLTR